MQSREGIRSKTGFCAVTTEKWDLPVIDRNIFGFESRIMELCDISTYSHTQTNAENGAWSLVVSLLLPRRRF